MKDEKELRFASTMKVYCSNCNYLKGYLYKDIQNIEEMLYGGYHTVKIPLCKSIVEREQTNTGLRVKYGNGLLHNENNNCPRYKKCWWKFWIRQ